MTKCPYCLNGWQRDVVTGTDEDGNEETHDIECRSCDGTGLIG